MRWCSPFRKIEQAMGDVIKSHSNSEKNNFPIVCKSIVVKRPIKRGNTFSEDNLAVKCPGTGIPLWSGTKFLENNQ